MPLAQIRRAALFQREPCGLVVPWCANRDRPAAGMHTKTRGLMACGWR